MSLFRSQDVLSLFLDRCCKGYGNLYAPSLWEHGVRSMKELEIASVEAYKEAGVNRRFHIDNIKEHAATPHVSQGSDDDDSLFVDVVLEHGDRVVYANLMVDTGCTLPLNISEYKAKQLGLIKEGVTAELEMGQGCIGHVTRRGAVLTKLQLTDEGDEVLLDPMRSAWLECWTDAASRCAKRPVKDDIPSQVLPAQADNNDGGGGAQLSTSSLKVKVLSPIRVGKCSQGYDAILGLPGMRALHLGIEKYTGRLYVKKRTAHRRITKRQARLQLRTTYASQVVDKE